MKEKGRKRREGRKWKLNDGKMQRSEESWLFVKESDRKSLDGAETKRRLLASA